MRTVTAAKMREMDRRAIEEFGVPGVVLMENAGRGAAEVALEMLEASASGPSGPVAVLAGRGNNGGDGYVVARHLVGAGKEVRVFLTCAPERVAGDAAVNLAIIERMGVSIEVIADPVDTLALRNGLGACALIVDGLLGTGLAGDVRGVAAEVIAVVNGLDVPVVALDIPSGLCADTGRPMGDAVRADCTVTFALPKRGFAEPGAGEFLGKLHVVGIGMPASIIRDALAEDAQA